MRKIDVVIGLNYGDEGKGHIVDYLAYESDLDVAVVRFNGGAQAGHTVEVGDKHHIFQHIGSGSFAGAATILSRFFVVNPILFVNEYIKLNKKLNIYVDPRSYVTTPYDVLINRLREKRNKHGSVGVGFNETIVRNLSSIPMKVSDLKYPEIVKLKLAAIREEYWRPIATELKQDRPDITEEFLDGADARFIEDVKYFLKATTTVTDVVAMKWFDHLVFEGAQGLRLDQYSEDFPHVTRSSTGLENVATLVENLDITPRVFYTTRSYLTRHGFGPLENETENPGVVDKTNITNKYQDHLRFAPHNFERMKADVTKDKKFLPDAEFHAAVTWCDFEEKGSNFLDTVINVMKAVGAGDIISSWGPGRNNIEGRWINM